jgi:hypothetical protein
MLTKGRSQSLRLCFRAQQQNSSNHPHQVAGVNARHHMDGGWSSVLADTVGDDELNFFSSLMMRRN